MRLFFSLAVAIGFLAGGARHDAKAQSTTTQETTSSLGGPPKIYGTPIGKSFDGNHSSGGRGGIGVGGSGGGGGGGGAAIGGSGGNGGGTGAKGGEEGGFGR
jgi:hypothetical protein